MRPERTGRFWRGQLASPARAVGAGVDRTGEVQGSNAGERLRSQLRKWPFLGRAGSGVEDAGRIAARRQASAHLVGPEAQGLDAAALPIGEARVLPLPQPEGSEREPERRRPPKSFIHQAFRALSG